jgi:hypothetical protein
VGHRGETLRLVAVPDAVVEHRPAVCAHCQTSLADAAVVLRERHQVQELPPVVRRVVHEHQVLPVRGPHCTQVRKGAFPAEAPRRAQDGSRVRALAAQEAGRPDLFRSPKRVLAHTWEGLL